MTAPVPPVLGFRDDATVSNGGETMVRLADRVPEIPMSGIREINTMASKMQDVITLAVGEPSFNTPDHILEAAAQAARDRETKYTASLGTPKLRQAIADHYTKKWNEPVSPDSVLVSTGGVAAIMMILLATINRGDEVLAPDPSWPNFSAGVKMCGGIPVTFPLRADNGFLPDIAELEKLVTPKTRMMMVNTPGNPTGAVFPREKMGELVDFAKRHDLILMSDEMYEEFVFDGVHTSVREFDNDPNVVVISGFSKTYAMTGWRLGYAIADPEIVNATARFIEAVYSCPPAPSQAAGYAALTGPQDCVREMRDAYLRRRNLVQGLLQPHGLLPVVPNGAFYAMVDFRKAGLPSRDIAIQLLQEEHVAAVPGTAFGKEAEGLLRISLASSDEDLEVACERMIAFAERIGATSEGTPTIGR